MSWTAPSDSPQIVLAADERELLYEIMAVVEVARSKRPKLTRSGIPPRPFWLAVNEEIVWQDPPSVLHDWDEADQVRFLYGLAFGVGALQVGDERAIEEGGAADVFFLASRVRRAEMLLRAYQRMEMWDERCDARDEEGNRYNFGQLFRRDFLYDPEDLRLALCRALAQTPEGGWYSAAALAEQLHAQAPDLLQSEDEAAVSAAEVPAELRRLVHYWLMLANRLGWADLGRLDADLPSEERRVYRVTRLGRAVLPDGLRNAPEWDGPRAAQRPFVMQPNGDVVLYRDDADVGDEYLLRRVADEVRRPPLVDRVVTYRLSRERLEAAFEAGADPNLVERVLFARSRHEVPALLRVLLEDALRATESASVQRGLVAMEVPGLSDETRRAMVRAGLEVAGQVVLVSPAAWTRFVHILGHEPEEAFSYPTDEPLAVVEGDRVVLEWPLLPMVARDLLVALGVAGDPPTLTIDRKAVQGLQQGGWAPRAVAQAIRGLTGGPLPPALTPYVRSGRGES